MAVEQLPGQVREFANYLDGLLARLDQGGGWCGVFWQRDPEGMQACVDGREVPPWDVVEALLQDLAAGYGLEAARAEAVRARALHAAALAAYDTLPGARDALRDRLDIMLREQRYAAERQAELGRLLASAASPQEADALRLDLAWARDDHARATARCAELRARMGELERRDASGRAAAIRRERGGEGEGGGSAVFSVDGGEGREGVEGAGGGVPQQGAGAAAPRPSEARGWWDKPHAGAPAGARGYGTERHVDAAGPQPGASGGGAGAGPGSGLGGGAGRGSGHDGGAGPGGGLDAGAGSGDPAVGSPHAGPGAVGSSHAGPGGPAARLPHASPGGPAVDAPGTRPGASPARAPHADPARRPASPPTPQSMPSAARSAAPVAGLAPPAPDPAPSVFEPAPPAPEPAPSAPESAPSVFEPAAPAPEPTPPAPRPAALTPQPAQPAPPTPQPTPPTPKQRKRRRGGARFAGIVEEEAAPAAVPPAVLPPVPEPGAGSGRTLRGARFAGVDATERSEPRAEPVDAADRREVAGAVARLVRLRAEGRSGEAHALLAEITYSSPARYPLLAAEMQHAGLGADWATLLWEAASLPADRLVAAADALVAGGLRADGEQILRQGVVRPAEEMGRAVLALAREGRVREIGALLDAYVRVRTPEEAARSAAADPQTLVPLLLEAARGVSEQRHWDLVHALRVAGFTT
nr:hypothetical protein [Streptomyces sp. CC219B]